MVAEAVLRVVDEHTSAAVILRIGTAASASGSEQPQRGIDLMSFKATITRSMLEDILRELVMQPTKRKPRWGGDDARHRAAAAGGGG